MTAFILQFTPRSEVGPQENLNAFVELCKQSDVLNARDQFQSGVWDIGHQKGKNGLLRAVFSTLEACESHFGLSTRQAPCGVGRPANRSAPMPGSLPA
jgi:hypothetical protein